MRTSQVVADRLFGRGWRQVWCLPVSDVLAAPFGRIQTPAHSHTTLITDLNQPITVSNNLICTHPSPTPSARDHHVATPYLAPHTPVQHQMRKHGDERSWLVISEIRVV